MAHVEEATRQARAKALKPLFAIARERGSRRGWLAEQTGVTIHRLWNYEHGNDRVPAGFIERFAQTLGVPASLITIPEPRDLYVQQPRAVKTPKAKGGQHANSDTVSDPKPVRRGKRPARSTDAPDAPGRDRQSRHHRTPRAGIGSSSDTGYATGRR